MVPANYLTSKSHDFFDQINFYSKLKGRPKARLRSLFWDWEYSRRKMLRRKSGPGAGRTDQVLTLLETKENLEPTSDYDTSAPASRQNYAGTPSKSQTSSSYVTVAPRTVQSEPPGTRKNSVLTSTTPAPILATKENSNPKPPLRGGQAIQIPNVMDELLADPYEHDETQNMDQSTGDAKWGLPIGDGIQKPSPQQQSVSSSSGSKSTTPTEKSSVATASTSGNKQKKKETPSASSSKSKSSSTKTKASTVKEESEKSALVPSKLPSDSVALNDPCAGLPGLNYAYCPPRSNAFVAPRIRLRDIDKKYSANICSSEYAKEIADDGSVNFAFRPRADYGTQVTFSVEPKKSPIWKTMLRCGFVPIINCGVPPCFLSQNMEDDSDDYSDSDSYDSDEYDSDYSSSSEDDKKSKNSGSTSNSKTSGSYASKDKVSQSTSGGSKSGSGSSSNKKKPKTGTYEEPCETCGDDSLTVTVADGQLSSSSSIGVGGGKIKSEKTIGVIDI